MLRHFNFIRIFGFAFIVIFVAPMQASASAVFLHFQNWQEAKNYYETLAPIFAAVEGTEIHHVIPRHQTSYERVEKIVDVLTAGYAKYFPSVAAQGKAPYILIVDDEEANAYALSDLTSDKNPYVFVVNKGQLNISDSALTGVIAHELAHLFLQYSENGKSVPETKYYFSSGKGVEFGLNIKNDDQVKPKIERLFELYDDAGPFSSPEMGSIPFGYDSQNMGPRSLQYLLATSGDSSSCAAARTWSELLEQYVYGHLNEANYRLILASTEQKAHLLNITVMFEKSARNCLAGKRVDYDELIMQTFSLPLEVFDYMKKTLPLKDLVKFEEAEREFAIKDAVDILLNAAKDARLEIAKIEAEVDLDDLRIFTNEDDADEISIYVAMQIGLDVNGLASDLLTMTDGKCDLSKEPSAYGAIEEPHHDTCWRIYRNTQYISYLQKMSAGERETLYNSKRSLVRPQVMFVAQ